MKDVYFEAELIAARPDGHTTNKDFIDRVMLGIRSPEIISNYVRRMDVNKKETFIMRLRHLPKLAVIALAIVGLAVIGGTTYAAYKVLWERPTVSVEAPSTNQFGRTQVAASFTNCANQSEATTFEIKSGSTLDPSEIGKILQARCELDALREWSGSNTPPKNPDPEMLKKEGTYTRTSRMTSPLALKVVSIDANSLKLGGDEHNAPKEPLALTNETQFIIDNHEATGDQIQPGDTVLYVQDTTYTLVTKKTDTGFTTSTALDKQVTTHVVKVGLPLEYYGSGKQNQIAQRDTCMGNAQDSCVQTPSVDLYENNSRTPVLPDANGKPMLDFRTIQGVITEHNGATLKIQTSSGRVFMLTTPRDIVSDFNSNRSAEYNNTTVKIGDTVTVNYSVHESFTGLELGSSQILAVNLALNMIQKGDPIQKY